MYNKNLSSRTWWMIAVGVLTAIIGTVVLGFFVNSLSDYIEPLFRDPIWQIVGAIVTILSALSSLYFEFVLSKVKKTDLDSQARKVSYKERLNNLLASLQNATAEVDTVFQEINDITRAREERLKLLETKLVELSNHEKELQTRIDTLKTVSIPAVEYFLESTVKSEKRSAVRDYVLFILGVLFSTVITLILKFAFGI